MDKQNNEYRPYEFLLEESEEEHSLAAPEEETDETLSKPSPAPRIIRELFDWAQSLVSAIVAIILLFIFVGSVYSVQQNSMQNTLAPNDMLLTSNLFYTPNRGDIIMFSQYGNPEFYRDGRITPHVKRVIGLPGDQIRFVPETSKLYINNVLQEEPYVWAESYSWGEFGNTEFVVPADALFVLGDNRERSLDSRSPSIGFVDRRHVLGRVLFRIRPLNQDWRTR